MGEAVGHLPLCSLRLVLETVPYIKDKNFSNVILTINRLRVDCIIDTILYKCLEWFHFSMMSQRDIKIETQISEH